MSSPKEKQGRQAKHNKQNIHCKHQHSQVMIQDQAGMSTYALQNGVRSPY